MFQARFHGRGGQGVVTAAELPAKAAFREGRHAQAFPSFGSEGMSAPGKRVLVVGAGPSGPSAACISPAWLTR